MITNGYVTLDELQATLSNTEETGVADYELAIESASRWIDGRCSDVETGRIRHFWQEQNPTARLYRADTVHLVRTSDFDSTDDMTVEVDLLGNGVWSVLDSDVWQPEPLVRLHGHPYSQVTVAAYGTSFPLDLKPRVRVTARWGWATVPKPVKQACQILAVASLLGKDVISNVEDYSIGSRGPADPLDLADHLLLPFMPPAEQDRLMGLEQKPASRSRRG